jgi:hypothetical protein
MEPTKKLKEMIEEAEAEVVRYRRLADDLREALKRATNGASEPTQLIKPRLSSKKAEPKSTLKTAIDVLGEQKKPVHIKDLVDMVSERRGQPTPRASIESVLVRALKDEKFGVTRPSPGMYAVER